MQLGNGRNWKRLRPRKRKRRRRKKVEKKRREKKREKGEKEEEKERRRERKRDRKRERKRKRGRKGKDSPKHPEPELLCDISSISELHMVPPAAQGWELPCGHHAPAVTRSRASAGSEHKKCFCFTLASATEASRSSGALSLSPCSVMLIPARSRPKDMWALVPPTRQR